MKGQGFLDRYFKNQSAQEKKDWNRVYRQKQRAVQIFNILHDLDRYGSTIYRPNKSDSIQIDENNKKVTASLQQYSKNKKEWNLESIKQEVEKDIFFALSDDAKLQLHLYDHLFIYTYKGKKGVVSKETKKVIVEPLYEDIIPMYKFSYRCIIGAHPDNLLYIATLGNKKGIVDSRGNTVLPCIYEDITERKGEFEHGLTLHANGKEGYVALEQDREDNYKVYARIEPFADRFSHIDFGYMFYQEAGIQKISAIHDDVNFTDEEGMYNMIDFEKKMMISRLGGEWVLRSFGFSVTDIHQTKILGWDKELEFIDVRNGPYLKYKKDGKYGINKRGFKDILLPEYDEIIDAGSGGDHLKFFARKGDKRGKMGRDGKRVFPVEFDEVKYPWDRWRMYGKKNGKRKIYIPENRKDLETAKEYNYEEEFDDLDYRIVQGDKHSTHVTICTIGGQQHIMNYGLTKRSRGFIGLEMHAFGYETGKGTYYDISYIQEGKKTQERVFEHELFNQSPEDIPF